MDNISENIMKYSDQIMGMNCVHENAMHKEFINILYGLVLGSMIFLPPPYGRTSRAWDSLLAMKSGCAGGRGLAPRPGQ